MQQLHSLALQASTQVPVQSTHPRLNPAYHTESMQHASGRGEEHAPGAQAHGKIAAGSSGDGFLMEQAEEEPGERICIHF